MTRRSGTLMAVFLGCACHGLTQERAVKLVRAYNVKVCDAYRAADATLVEGLVGDAEAKRLTGLIGAKLDQGITLDAQMLEMSALDFAAGDEVLLTTHERWEYRDRKIGTGAQVGESSLDEYQMRYHLSRVNGHWLVMETEFATPPQVGRAQAPNSAPVQAFHSMKTQAPEAAP